MAEHPLSTLFDRLTLIDQHPPLYYTLLHFWLLPGMMPPTCVLSPCASAP